MFFCVFKVEVAAVAYGDCGFYDHHSIRVDAEDEVDHFFHLRRVEIVFHRVVVGGGCDDDEISILVGRFSVERGSKVKLLLGEVFFNVIVLDRRYAAVDKVDFLRDDVYGRDVVVLAKRVAMESPT